MPNTAVLPTRIFKAAVKYSSAVFNVFTNYSVGHYRPTYTLTPSLYDFTRILPLLFSKTLMGCIFFAATLPNIAYSNAVTANQNGHEIIFDDGNITDISYSKDRRFAVFVKSDEKQQIIRQCDNLSQKCKNIYRLAHKDDAYDHLETPIFSLTGKDIFFVRGGSTAGSYWVYKQGLDRKKPQRLTAGMNIKIVHSGKYKGYLVVQKHKYFLSGGSYDFYCTDEQTPTEIVRDIEEQFNRQ
jgi:Tol biopolymer transport system component